MKKIVVTGATSMLGVATIEECLRNDIEVVAVVHRNSKNIYRLPQSPKLQIIEANLDELSNCTPNFNDADVFYHFAWAATNRTATHWTPYALPKNAVVKNLFLPVHRLNTA